MRTNPANSLRSCTRVIGHRGWQGTVGRGGIRGRTPPLCGGGGGEGERLGAVVGEGGALW